MTYFMYIFCLVVWGLNFIVVKIQGTPVVPEVSLAYRLIAAALMFIIAMLIIKPKGRPTYSDTPFLVVFGLCNFALSYLCFYYATLWISAALVTLIFSLKTVLTPIALRLFMSRSLKKQVIIGGIVGISGVSLLVFPSLSSNYQMTHIQGIFLALLGTIITAIGDVSSARNAEKGIHPFYANSVGFCVASILLLIICIGNNKEFNFPLTKEYVGALLYLIILASFLAWLFYLKLVERIGATSSSYMVALFPAVGGIASVIMGDTVPNVYLLFGCILSSVGAAIALGFFQNIPLPLSISNIKKLAFKLR